MVVQSQPSGDAHDIRLIGAWRPANSQTVLWAQDMKTGRLLYLVQWGDSIYLPVTEGLNLGIGVYNGSNRWMAYPTYIEAKNLYDNGPSQPDECTSDDMWEVRPGTSFVMAALKNRDQQTGRPLIIVPNGLGMGIGEATYGTDEYRGQIRVYERSVIASTVPQQPTSPYPDFDGYRGGSSMRGGSPESFSFGGPTRSAGPAMYDTVRGGSVSRGIPKVGTNRQVGIGAGAETTCPSRQTGMQYNRDSLLVAALRVESRADLTDVLHQARRANTQWWWTPNSPMWFTTWGRPPASPVSPHIPVAGPAPHRPYGYNRGEGTY